MARSSSSIPSTISELFLYIYNCTFCTIGGYEKETHHLLDYYINQKTSPIKQTNDDIIIIIFKIEKQTFFLHTMGLTVVVLSGGGMHVQIVSSEG